MLKKNSYIQRIILIILISNSFNLLAQENFNYFDLYTKSIEYEQKGEYGEALKLCLQSKIEFEQSKLMEDSNYCNILHLIGRIYLSLDSIQKSVEINQICLSKKAIYFGTKEMSYFKTLNNLILGYYQLKNTSQYQKYSTHFIDSFPIHHSKKNNLYLNANYMTKN